MQNPSQQLSQENNPQTTQQGLSNDGLEKHDGLNVIVLFSLGVPLSLWQKTGLFAREKSFYSRFCQQGHMVSLLTYGKQDLTYEEIWQPINILPWVGHLTHFVKYACVAPFLHREAFLKANIVKSNQSQGSLVGALAKLVNPKLKFVLRCGWVRTKEIIREQECRTGMKYYRAIFFEWLGYKLANAIIVVTESDAAYLIENYGANARKIHIIPNSIDTQSYHYSPPAIDQKIAAKQAIKVLLVGRLVEAKNFHKVFSAIADLPQFKFEVTVAGEGDYRSQLEKKATLLALNIEFAGSVANDELANFYATHDIVIMPEAWGSGMPKVVLEAMASGAVIIASNIRSVNQLLRCGENGFVCEPNTESIGESLQTVMLNSDEELQKIASVARHEIETHYSMDACVKKEIELYKSLL